MEYDIEFKDVSFRYAGAEKDALSGINLNICPGDIVLVTGPAGSGKTTFCSCINGLVPHYHEGELSGQVIVRSYDTKRARIGGLASLVGMVFQDPDSQLVTSSVADEVAFGPENLGVPRAEINQRVTEALSATRLIGFEEREPHNLSGGEQQACSIAATYSMHPEIYVMDEPLANLDPAGRLQVLQVLIDVAKQRQKTLIIVEHSLEEVLPLVDRVLVMEGGQIVRDGTVDKVLAEGDIPRVFTRPALVRLADKFGLDLKTYSAEKFYADLNAFKPLGVIEAADGPPAQSARSSTPLIEFQNVHYAYKGQAEALSGVNLLVHEGELVAILGRNGSGKTTLVRHIIGLLHPSEGRVLVAGRDVAVTPTHELTQEIGFCFQNPNHQLVAFNVRDEMTFGLKAHNIDPSEFDERIYRALDQVNMLDALDAEIFDLGKGQKQRLALASVLTLNPKILVIDEPTTGQDPQMTKEIFDIIQHLNDLGTTIVMITHRVDYAAAYASRAIVMNRGAVAFDGPVLDLISDVEMMRANSLDLPDITKLALQLRQHGVPPWTIKYEQLEHHLGQLVEASRGD
ncbi:MAG: energy-coupling factor ABC transporter ATP-binding protein [Anaerolineae bacterium]|nr:energy-coupling factor ABC transporter ATP-binding protein [Anaerolineae bacterium]MCI0609557.1 energy-coupling factor ABC transporter ATP-binding protein [Anaerolineae bacterium]